MRGLYIYNDSARSANIAHALADFCKQHGLSYEFYKRARPHGFAMLIHTDQPILLQVDGKIKPLAAQLADDLTRPCGRREAMYYCRAKADLSGIKFFFSA